MRRSLTWAEAALASLMLSLAVAACVLWVRSGRRTDGVSFRPTLRRQFAVFTYRSSLYWERTDWDEDQTGRLRWDRVSESAAEADTGLHTYTDFDRWGFKRGGGRLLAWHFFGVPLPGLALVAAAPPAWWAVRRLRRGPPRAGHCPACGYDLTGNVSGRCPECGNPAPTAKGAA